MPSFLVQRQPYVLMAIDNDTTCSPDTISLDSNIDDAGSETEDREPKGRVRIINKSPQRVWTSWCNATWTCLLFSNASQIQIIRKTVGVDDDMLENEEDENDSGGGVERITLMILSTPLVHNPCIFTRFIISQETAEKGGCS